MRTVKRKVLFRAGRVMTLFKREVSQSTYISLDRSSGMGHTRKGVFLEERVQRFEPG
jgi:hypothetical protein